MGQSTKVHSTPGESALGEQTTNKPNTPRHIDTLGKPSEAYMLWGVLRERAEARSALTKGHRQSKSSTPKRRGKQLPRTCIGQEQNDSKPLHSSTHLFVPQRWWCLAPSVSLRDHCFLRHERKCLCGAFESLQCKEGNGGSLWQQLWNHTKCHVLNDPTTLSESKS